MTNRLSDLGAEIVELPASSIQIFDKKMDFSEPKNIVFTDQLSIEMFIRAMKISGIDWRNLMDWRFVTVGHHTGAALKRIGICPDHEFIDVPLCLQEFQVTSNTLFLGDSFEIARLNEQRIPGKKVISHEEKITAEIPKLWQETDFMYFPNSKSARLFLTTLSTEELAIVRKKKVVVMGNKTKAIFEDYHLPVIVTNEPSYKSVIDKLIEEM